MADIKMQIIARMKSDFGSKFGIPRQSGLVDSLHSTIIFEPDFRNKDAVRGIETYSHLWLIWQFSEAVRNDWSATVRPPRLGGNVRMGVFATRSPFRPNSIGLSCVKIIGVEDTASNGTVIHVSGADLLDGTPILDIKPYIPYADSHPDAVGGFTDNADDFILEVDFPAELIEKIPQNKRDALIGVLSHDPRPSYQNNSDRVYGLTFAGYNIRFRVDNGKLTVTEISRI